MAYRCVGKFVILVLVAGCAARPPASIGVDNPKTPVASISGNSIHTIFFATNRAPAEAPAELFSGERGDALAYGSMEVSVPPNHELGNIERASRLPPDPRRHFVITDPQIYNEKMFVFEMNSQLAERPPGERDILVFVHGYNTRLDEAVVRLAQFVNDTGFTGVPVLFSWPSRGKKLDYVYDLNSAFSSRDALEQTAATLRKTRAREANLLAHSMGNVLTVETMRQMQKKGEFNRAGALRNVVLASPDIDIDLFKSQIAVFPPNNRRFFVLVSEDDRPLRLSRRLAGGIDRVGSSDPEQFEGTGVIVIDLSEIDDRSSGHHAKFADSPDIVKMISENLKTGDSLATRVPTIGENLPIRIVIN